MINEKEAPEGYRAVKQGSPVVGGACKICDYFDLCTDGNIGSCEQYEREDEESVIFKLIKPKDRTGIVQIGKDRKITGWKFTDGEGEEG